MIKKVLISGFGGQGSLLIGQVLAQAAVLDDKFSTYRPVYGFEKRGGIAYCDVIVSDERIGNPVLEETQALVAMDERSFTRFEELVIPGGVLIYNSSLVTSAPSRDDIRYIAVPCIEMADELGSEKVVNMIIFGAYLGSEDFISMDIIEEALREKMGPSKEKLIPLNRKALEEGAGLAKNS